MKIGARSKIYETAKIVSDGDREIDIGDDCLVGDFAFIAVKKLVMRDCSQISPHAIVSGGGEAELRKYSVVGFGVQLITGTDTTEGKYMCEAASKEYRTIIRGKITLEEGAYIGAYAIVCVSKRSPEIVIGEHAVVGSMSYIDKSIDPFTIVYPVQNLKYKIRVVV
jgi:acetyltransferase-like isoleucine patch superfamily enzyme